MSKYRSLPANERQEFRLPALLKEHLARAAEQAGQSVAEYITVTLAERVTRDLAVADWSLTPDEQAHLMRVLATNRSPSARANAVTARADKLFGPLE
jgi:hypothetical protein